MLRADGHILGVFVGSTAPVFLVVLAVHVAAGLTAVASGAVAALAPKGGLRHVQAGRVFYRALAVLFGTALILTASRFREDVHLALIGAVAVIAATLGVRHRRLHRPGDTPHIVGMGAAYVAMLTAFYVDNGPHLPGWDHLPDWVFYVLPAVVGAPLVTRAVRRAAARSARPQ
jgi:hypothetical protein